MRCPQNRLGFTNSHRGCKGHGRSHAISDGPHWRRLQTRYTHFVVAKHWEALLLSRRRKRGSCWEWTGSVASNGYGQINVNLKHYYIHRVAARLWLDDWDLQLCVLHTCDNRLGFNPKHLRMGTKADNCQDMWNKGRGHPHYGEDNPAATLTEKQVKVIIASPKSPVTLARRYNVTVKHIRRLRRGEEWTHLRGGDV